MIAIRKAIKCTLSFFTERAKTGGFSSNENLEEIFQKCYAYMSKQKTTVTSTVVEEWNNVGSAAPRPAPAVQLHARFSNGQKIAFKKPGSAGTPLPLGGSCFGRMVM